MSDTVYPAKETFSLPVGTVTFLLTDIEGSTRAWEAEPVAMAKAVARHYELLAEAIGRHGGVRPMEQGEGDSVVGAFARSSDALASALDVQIAIGAEPWPDGIDLQVRVALHAGEAQLRDQGNYFGQAIIRCARLRALAHGGQVLVSRAVHDLVADRVGAGVTLRDLGSHRLRDLGRPEQVFQVCHPDLPAEFPPLQSLDAVPNNLPIQLTSFVGRRGEMAELNGLLDDIRLLTLTGSGGCGKTRLALQLAAERLDHFPDGVWYVELAPLGETTSVARTVADALNVAEEPDRPFLDSLVDRLTGRRALLIIDNCEHLLTESATVVEALLRSCPDLHVLATSRTLLNVAGETPWRVPSLALPDAGEPPPLDVLTQFDAVRLFVERAVKSRPNFVLSSDNAAAVAEICQRLDGIPLAIELAAARIRALAPEQIARGLDDRFRLLTGGSSTLLPRQQTLRASVDWSHHLLSEPERTVFRRLSVFAGGFTLDAAEATCAGDEVDGYEVLDLLGGLADRSLVQVDDAGHEMRYALLETIKQYGRERLDEADEYTATRDRHLRWFAQLADQARPGLVTRDQTVWLERLEADHDNLRAALEWAVQGFDFPVLLRMAVDLTFFWFLAGHFQEGNGWLERALAETAGPPSAMRARARWGMAYLNFYAGNMVLAAGIAEEALAWGEAVGDDLTVARALDTLGSLQQVSDPQGALATLDEAISRARAGKDDWCLTDSLQKAAWCFMWRERYDEMSTYFDESRVHAARLGNPFFLAYERVTDAWVALRRGDVKVARAAAIEASSAAARAREPITVLFAAWFHAQAEALAGEHPAATRIVANCHAETVRRGATPFDQLASAFIQAQIQLVVGDPAEAEVVMEQAMIVMAGEGMVVMEALGLPWLAEALLVRGQPEQARHHLRRLLEVAAAHDNPWALGKAHYLLARADRTDGDHQAAEDHAHEALAVFVQLGLGPDVADTLDLVALLAADDQSWAEAARLFAAVDTVRADCGWVRWPARQDTVDAALAAAVAALGQAEFATATTEGLSLTLDGVVAYARRSRGTRGRPSSGWRSLTPTELQVVRLVAVGLTNPQIGERLFVARGTVKVHLTHIFTKLGVATRAELAAEATRREM